MRLGRCISTVVTGALLACAADGCREAGVPRASNPAVTVDSTASENPYNIYSASSLPIPDLGYSAREGRVLYRHYCLNCHGDAGKGDGFNAYNLDPRPRSLADSTFQAQHSDSDLVTAIRSGGGAVGLSTGMPPWGRTLDGRQVEHVVEFLRTLPAEENGKP
jgi:mono/diheme cytochrome c family protein